MDTGSDIPIQRLSARRFWGAAYVFCIVDGRNWLGYWTWRSIVKVLGSFRHLIRAFSSGEYLGGVLWASFHF